MNTSANLIKRAHSQRLREVYRSAGWPFQDAIEVELLAAGLLARVRSPMGHEWVRLTDEGIACLARTTEGHRQARSAHEALVDAVCAAMQKDGRSVWKNLSLRAQLPGDPDAAHRWKMCQPDVFSIRHSSREDYLDPIVHEIKVSRSDLLGDLKKTDKRQAYLDVGGQCWYVLGCDRSGHPIARPNEIPVECGVLIYQNGQFEVARMAPKKTVQRLAFSVWMALAKASPVPAPEGCEFQPELSCHAVLDTPAAGLG